MFGSFIDLEKHEPELAIEVGGTFHALENALILLLRDSAVRDENTNLVATFV